MPIFFLLLLLLLLIASPLVAQTAPQTYHVNPLPTCADVPGAGTTESPYCTLRYVSTIAKPGDTFLIQPGRYGQGPTTFTRSGTVDHPITYKAIGDVVIGSFIDITDEDFQAGQLPGVSLSFVYTIRLQAAVKPSRVYQTFFPDILVDSTSNQSIFTMRDADGPLALTQVTDSATLGARDGTWLYDAGMLHVHAFGHRVPSLTATDFVISTGPALGVTGSYNVFDGFRVPYAAGAGTSTSGSFNRFLNMTFQGNGWAMRGKDNLADGLTITHVIARGPTWFWTMLATGTAMSVYGTGQVVKNADIFHNWNSSISADGSTGMVIDGLRMHGGTNHCGAYGKNSTIRNAVFYNCQDYFYLNEAGHHTIDHTVNPLGVAFQGLTAATGTATVTNSILNGSFGATFLTPLALCTWERGTTLERNIISTTATIRRCADRKEYPILDYMAKCASGVFGGCMTFKDNVFVAHDWKTVIVDGRWTGVLGDAWDVTLVPGSPAIGAAMDGLDIGPLQRPSLNPVVPGTGAVVAPHGVRILH